MDRSVTGLLKSAMLTEFFPARERTRIVTSTISFGSAGPTSRAPSSGARSLPARGTRFFAADITLLHGQQEQERAENIPAGALVRFRMGRAQLSALYKSALACLFCDVNSRSERRQVVSGCGIELLRNADAPDA